MKKSIENTNLIIEKVKENELNDLSYDYMGDFKKLVLNETELFLYDFVDKDTLTETEEDILNSFSISLVPTSNYHHEYFNSMNITLNQLDYGMNFPEISDEGELETILLDRIEIGNIKDEEEKQGVIALFIETIDVIISSVYKVEDMILSEGI